MLFLVGTPAGWKGSGRAVTVHRADRPDVGIMSARRADEASDPRCESAECSSHSTPMPRGDEDLHNERVRPGAALHTSSESFAV